MCPEVLSLERNELHHLKESGNSSAFGRDKKCLCAVYLHFNVIISLSFPWRFSVNFLSWKNEMSTMLKLLDRGTPSSVGVAPIQASGKGDEAAASSCAGAVLAPVR